MMSAVSRAEARLGIQIPEELLDADRLPPALGRKPVRDEFADADLPWNQNQIRLGVSRFGQKPNEYFDKPAGGGGMGSLSGAGRGGYGGGPLGGSGFGKGAGSVSGSGQGGGSGYRSGAFSGGNPGFGKTFTVQKLDSLDYGPGDRVRHIKFGEGTVRQVQDGGRDFEVTVEFDKAGVKKMFASFAKLQKL